MNYQEGKKEGKDGEEEEEEKAKGKSGRPKGRSRSRLRPVCTFRFFSSVQVSINQNCRIYASRDTDYICRIQCPPP